MKILKSKHFISERMKIIPITNDEFDKVKDYKEEYYTFTEIENPSYDDMLVSGNVVITSDFGSKKALWICIGNKDMKRIGINRDDVDFAVDRKSNRRISWNDVEGWHEKFPYHRMFGTGMSVICIYKTDIDVSLMNEGNFEKIYYKIVEQYKNKYPDINIIIDKSNT